MKKRISSINRGKGSPRYKFGYNIFLRKGSDISCVPVSDAL